MKRVKIPEHLQVFRAMYETERDQTLINARKKAAGPEPKLEQIADENSVLSPEVNKTIRYLVLTVLIAAFAPSAIRIFDEAVEATNILGTLSDVWKAVNGVSAIAMAEAGQVVCMLALVIYGKSRWNKIALWITAIFFTIFALTGNLSSVEPWTTGSVFKWLEAFSPLVVLTMANILKQQWINDASNNWRAKSTLEKRQKERELRYEEPELYLLPDDKQASAKRWRKIQAAQTKASLYKIYSSINATKDLVKTLTDEDWRVLIMRELTADEWYDDMVVIEEPEQLPEPILEPLPEPDPAGLLLPGDQPELLIPNVTVIAGNVAGVSANVRNRANPDTVWKTNPDDPNSKYTVKCPECDLILGTDFSTKRSAINARSRHRGKVHGVNEPPPVIFEELSARS